MAFNSAITPVTTCLLPCPSRMLLTVTLLGENQRIVCAHPHHQHAAAQSKAMTGEGGDNETEHIVQLPRCTSLFVFSQSFFVNDLLLAKKLLCKPAFFISRFLLPS